MDSKQTFRIWVAVSTAATLMIIAAATTAGYQAQVNQENQTERVRVCVENGYNAAECEDMGR